MGQVELNPNTGHPSDQVVREREIRFRTILDHLLDVAYRRDLHNDRYDYISPGIERLAGVTAEEISNWPVSEVLEHIHPADRPALEQVIQMTTEQPGQWEHVEYRFMHRDGRYRWFAENTAVICDRENNEEYRIGTVRDVTEQNQAEELDEALAGINELIHSTLDPDEMRRRVIGFANKLASSISLALENAQLYNEQVQAEQKLQQALEREQAAHAEAEAAVRLRDHFFNVAAHELRNPLTTMMGYSELLTQPGALDNPERVERSVRTIHQQTIRLNKMIGALLDVSRIVEGRFTLDRAPFNLAPLVTRIVDEFRLNTHKHALHIMLPDEPLIVNGDEMRLEQVLRNLIGNAIKYTPKGGPIQIAVERCDNMACVSVTDCGIGIPADALPHLFTRFYRASNAEAQHIPGLGIGLFVIHEIIAQHGGKIQVESTEGVGTTFTIHLPM